MLVIIMHYLLLSIAAGLAAYGIFLAFTKQWKRLTIVAYLLTVTIFFLAHVIPELSRIGKLDNNTMEFVTVAVAAEVICAAFR